MEAKNRGVFLESCLLMDIQESLSCIWQGDAGGFQDLFLWSSREYGQMTEKQSQVLRKYK